MRVLLVEDDSNVQGVFRDHCAKSGIALDVAPSLAQAMLVIDDEAHEYDLAVCDLKIPSGDGLLDEAVEHGLAALRAVLQQWPGVPVIVLSAFGTVDVVADLLLDAKKVDAYGRSIQDPMLRFVQKARLVDVVEIIDSIGRELATLDQIELAVPDLAPMYVRALRIFARRKAGTLIEYRQLAGGRSGASTGLANVRNAEGANAAHVVAKLTSLVRAEEEVSRYRRSVSGRLPAATFADLSDLVTAGCGNFAGLFYSVADSFDRDLFALLASDSAAAARVVAGLEELSQFWLGGCAQSVRPWVAVRRNLISDADFASVQSAFPVVAIAEDRSIQTVWAPQHGDLHGANVLVDASERSVLIDFGRTGEACSVLDPLTLELSAFLHPDSPFRASAWPAVDDLDNWADLDVYLERCPYPDFVKVCRDWAMKVRVGQRDLFATVSAYCLRNLQFDDVDKDKALRLQQVAAGRVNSS